MKKLSKINILQILLTILVFVFLVLVLRKIAVIQDIANGNLRQVEIRETMKDYKDFDVNMIVVGNFSESVQYCFLTKVQDPEDFTKMKEMFWGRKAGYKEIQSAPQKDCICTVTFANSLGEMLPFYIYPDDEVSVGGIGEDGVHYTFKNLDYDYIKQLVADATEQQIITVE